MNFEKKILCIGAGYVGGPTMAMIAYKCPHCRVTVVDINPERIAAWNSDDLPIYEPGLDRLIAATRGRNLFFSTDIEGGIRENDIIFVSVNTPTKTFGLGAGMAADLQYWEKTARQILEFSESSKIVIEKSTLPVKTALAMERILNCRENGICFDVLSNPEFLAEGTAISDLEQPDRILIGSRETERGLKARETLAEIYADWVPPERIHHLQYLEQRTFQIGRQRLSCPEDLLDQRHIRPLRKGGADVTEVARAVGMDSRIGPRFLNASVGFGGSCFKKDIMNLVYLCRHYGLEEVADYWESVVKINRLSAGALHPEHARSDVQHAGRKKDLLVGFRLQGEHGRHPGEPRDFIARRLLEERAEIVISDPKALKNARKDLAGLDGQIRYIEDPTLAAKGCHAIAVLTEWDIYRHLDFRRIYGTMLQPAFIFDGRNVLDHHGCFAIGFNVYPVGKPPLTHF